MAEPLRDAITHIFKQFAGQASNLVIPRPYVDFCKGDHLAALLLSQILYWSDRTDDKDGWFAKSYDDWEKELGMTEYQVRRAIHGDKRSKNGFAGLEALGVESRLKPSKFYGGAPALHYRVAQEVLSKQVLEFAQNAVLDNVQNESVQGLNNVQNGVPNIVQDQYTETTTKTTKRSETIDSASQADAVETSTSVEGIAVSPEIPDSSETERTETQQAARPRTERQQMIDFCMDFWQCPGGEAAVRADQLLGRSKSGRWKDANLVPAATVPEANGFRLWIKRSHKERPNAAWVIEKEFVAFRASSAYQDAIREANEPVHIVIPPAEITPPEVAQARAQEYRATIAALAAGKRLIPERTTHESAA